MGLLWAACATSPSAPEVVEVPESSPAGRWVRRIKAAPILEGDAARWMEVEAVGSRFQTTWFAPGALPCRSGFRVDETTCAVEDLVLDGPDALSLIVDGTPYEMLRLLPPGPPLDWQVPNSHWLLGDTEEGREIQMTWQPDPLPSDAEECELKGWTSIGLPVTAEWDAGSVRVVAALEGGEVGRVDLFGEVVCAGEVVDRHHASGLVSDRVTTSPE